MISQAHEALGMAQSARKKYDLAVAEFKLSVEGAANPDPGTFLRLGDALHQVGKYDEAVANFDKVMANANAPAQIKQFAQSLRVRSIQARDKDKPAAPAAPAAAPAPAAPAVPAAATKKP
jgi:hypothetical protein